MADIEQLQAKITEITTYLNKLEGNIEAARIGLEKRHDEAAEVLIGLRAKGDEGGIAKLKAEAEECQSILNSLLWEKGVLAYRQEALVEELRRAESFEHEMNLWRSFGLNYLASFLVLQAYNAQPVRDAWSSLPPIQSVKWQAAVFYSKAMDCALQLGYRLPADADSLAIIQGRPDILRPAFDEMIRLEGEWGVQLGPSEDQIRPLIKAAKPGEPLEWSNVTWTDYRVPTVVGRIS